MKGSKVYVTKEFEFDSAHFLPGYYGKCQNVHGHTYRLQITVSGVILTDLSTKKDVYDLMVIDFVELKRIVDEIIINKYDHQVINEIMDLIPTAECMVVEFYYTINDKLPIDVKLESVKLWETPNSFAEYRGETGKDIFQRNVINV